MTLLRSGSRWEKLDVVGSVIVTLFDIELASQSIIIRFFLFSLLII